MDSHNHPDPKSKTLNPDPLKPDISVYARNSGRDRPTDFSLMECHIEVKLDERDDAFVDNPTKGGPKKDNPRKTSAFERDVEVAKDTKGQITSYAVAQLATQFRVHLFTVLVCGRYARLFRWDRSGVVVTAAFDYCDRYLADFFWRYDRAELPGRGGDTTVSIPSEAEQELARLHLKCSPKEPLVKFAVHDDKNNKVSYYVGSKPTFKGTTSPTGRATRTFIVYDLQINRVVFLKDTWRIDLPNVVKEGEIYEELQNANVPHIAPFQRGGDIPHQRTRTQDFAKKTWAYKIEIALRPHHHYRVVLGVVGRDLTSFDSTWEMVGAVRDALQGAYT